jgi:phage terminase small subunit
LSLVPVKADDRQRRLKKPKALRGVAAVEWRRVVDSMPRAFFTLPMMSVLTSYCRTVELAQRVEAELARCKDLKSREAHRLLQAQDRLTKNIASLATRLRLTPQRRMATDTAVRRLEAEGGERRRAPWEVAA